LFTMESLFSESKVSPSTEQAHRIKSLSSESVGRFISSSEEISSSDSDEKSSVDEESPSSSSSPLSSMLLLCFFSVVDLSSSSRSSAYLRLLSLESLPSSSRSLHATDVITKRKPSPIYMESSASIPRGALLHIRTTLQILP
jgi:hypothetical protein